MLFSRKQRHQYKTRATEKKKQKLLQKTGMLLAPISRSFIQLAMNLLKENAVQWNFVQWFVKIQGSYFFRGEIFELL